MSERLIIDNFAGLKHVEIDLKKINVFIGPQATGKSVTAKLAYFFKRLPSEILIHSMQKEAKAFRDEQIEKFCQFFPLRSLSDTPFTIGYYCGEEFAEVSGARNGSPLGIGFRFSGSYDDLATKFSELMRPSSPGATHEDRVDERLKAYLQARSYFSDLASGRHLSGFNLEQLFVPSGRSFFAFLLRRVFSVLSAEGTLDPFIVEFGRQYESSKEMWWATETNARDWRQRKYPELVSLVNEIVGAEYVREGAEDFVRTGDGRLVQLTNASSAQQEALPLTMVLAVAGYTNPIDTYIENTNTCYIEEPEAHLYPNTQKLVVELVSVVFNSRDKRYQFLITTHSPYILTAFNNLMEAGKIAEELAGNADALKKLHAIVPASRIISPKDVAAYYFDKGGAESIIDEEGLIRFDQIDSVSEDISIQFGKLLDIEVRR